MACGFVQTSEGFGMVLEGYSEGLQHVQKPGFEDFDIAISAKTRFPILTAMYPSPLLPRMSCFTLEPRNLGLGQHRTPPQPKSTKFDKHGKHHRCLTQRPKRNGPALYDYVWFMCRLCLQLEILVNIRELHDVIKRKLVLDK